MWRIWLTVPDRLSLGRRSIGIGAAAIWLTAAATLAGEYLVESRRGPLLAPALRRHGDLAGFADAFQFLAILAAAHLFATFCLYQIVRRLHGRYGRAGLVAYEFVALAFFVAAAVYATKMQFHRFFGRTVDLEIARGLGGGSLLEALAYVRREALLLLLCLAPLLLAWFLVRRLLRTGEAPSPQTPPGRGLAKWAIATAVTAALLLWAGQRPVMRYQVARFGAPWLLYAAFSAATDPDRDGYSLFSSPVDGRPFDAARHPFALDVPGNGIDEDDFAGDFQYRARVRPEPVFADIRRHVVLVVLESTRAEAIGRRWQGRLVAPNLSALATAGSSAPEAYTHQALSAPSLKTIFTGRIAPAPHGPSLFRDFREAGYRVAVLSSQAEDFGGIAATVGMRENSDIFVDAEAGEASGSRNLGGHSRSVLDGRMLLREMDRRLGDASGWARPTFLYINLQAPHFPYSSPETPQILPGGPIPRERISATNREWVARTYWNAVAYSDWLLGRILARLRANGVYDEAVVVVVADHGEELFENGYVGHGHGLNRLQGQVPLVFSRRLPLPRPVGHQDLRVLILGAAGAAGGEPPTGRPVLQFVGDLEHPWQIAMVERGGRWTIYTPATGAVWATEAGSAGDYGDLPPGHPLRARVEQLVDLWMTARWEQDLALRGRAARAP